MADIIGLHQRSRTFLKVSFQSPSLYIIDKAPNRDAFRQPGMGLYFLDLLPDVFLQIAERMEGNRSHRRTSRLLYQFRPQILIFERQHSAVRVVDDDEFLGSQ